MILLQGLLVASFVLIIVWVASLAIGVPVFVCIKLQKKLKHLTASGERPPGFLGAVGYILYYTFAGIAVAAAAAGAFYLLVIIIGQLIRYSR